MSMPTMVIRADGGPSMGFGHLMRCLALAQAWKAAGGAATLLTASSNEFVTRSFTASRVQVVQTPEIPGTEADAAAMVLLARSLAARFLVVDGYHFGIPFQNALRASRAWITLIADDAQPATTAADLILNQNLHAAPELYRGTSSVLLLGPRYTLLRRELLRPAQSPRVCPEVARNVLITFGGSDPTSACERAHLAIRLAHQLGLHARIIVGPASHPEGGVKDGASEGSRIEVLRSVADVSPLMRWADVAVTAAGSTCWELAYFGVPMIVASAAPNQLPIAESLCRVGAAVNCGDAREFTARKLADLLCTVACGRDLRQRMAERSQSLVDGQGAERVATQIAALGGAKGASA